MSNYRRGLTVFDITDPNQPNEIGFFDTYPSPAENSATFAGAWGTYPFLPSGNILITDSSYGLFVVKAAANNDTPPPAPTPPASGGSGGGSTSVIFLLFMSLLLLGQLRCRKNCLIDE